MGICRGNTCPEEFTKTDGTYCVVVDEVMVEAELGEAALHGRQTHVRGVLVREDCRTARDMGLQARPHVCLRSVLNVVQAHELGLPAVP